VDGLGCLLGVRCTLNNQLRTDMDKGNCQVGSLAGVARLLKDNAGVLRGTH